MSDEVVLSIAEDHPLIGSYSPQPERKRGSAGQGHDGDRASGDRHDPRRARQVVHRRKDRWITAGASKTAALRYWNVTGNVNVLFELFFSPGTVWIVAVTV